MRLHLTVPERPGMVYFIPILDLLALLFLFPVLISNLSLSGGYKASLPDYPNSIPSATHAIVVRLLPGEKLQIWVNKDLVPEDQLEERLDEESSKWIYGGDPVVSLEVDKSIPSGSLADILNVLDRKSFSVWVIGNYKR
jgi:biopolymer transport protein ExbD